jgi:hypothetical protein
MADRHLIDGLWRRLRWRWLDRNNNARKEMGILMLHKTLKTYWKHTFLLAFILFIAAGVVSAIFPWQTKISKFIGIPFRFYGEGILPWLGDLEDKKVFFTGGLFLNIFFWFLISSIILLLFRVVKFWKINS